MNACIEAWQLPLEGGDRSLQELREAYERLYACATGLARFQPTAQEAEDLLLRLATDTEGAEAAFLACRDAARHCENAAEAYPTRKVQLYPLNGFPL